MKQVYTGDFNELREKIWALDLEPIMVKLMDEKEGEGWTEAQAFVAIEEYRRFLYLTATRTVPIVPTYLIDTVWHAHILDTEKYREDCQHLFGFFLDHYPYFGMRGEADRKALEASFLVAASIYEKVFGSSYHVTIDGLKAGNCTCNDGCPNSCGTCAGSGVTGKTFERAIPRPTLAMFRELNPTN